MDRALPMAGKAAHAEALHASPAFMVIPQPYAVRSRIS
jgi:hypothetical protein